ncbi:MAG: hypothetical protein IMX02_12290 [Limnochordaceae bacterium]|nr:hypothetical protein [Limnochordaceae bacterium]
MRRWTFGVVGAAVLAWSGVAQAAGGAVAPSPYLVLGSPVAANPAAFAWQALSLSAGPVSLESFSSAWTVGDVVRSATSGDPWKAIGELAGRYPGRPRSSGMSGAARLRANVMAFEVGYGLMAQAGAHLPAGFLKLAADAARQALGGPYDLTGTRLVSAAWSDLSVRANTPVPVIPRALGLSSFSVGAGVHFLKGHGYYALNADGQFSPPAATGPDLRAWRSSDGTGYAVDAGIVAGLRPSFSMEAAVVGYGQLQWTGVEEATALQADGTLVWQPTKDVTYVLPATALVAAHWRPLPAGLLELTGGYARVGINKPGEEAFNRLYAQADAGLGRFVRAGLGVVKDSVDPEARVYGSISGGAGVVTASLQVVNVQELPKGADAKSLGLGLMVSGGF